MESPPPAPFLDPSRLLDSSRPLPRISLTWWAGAGFVVVVLVTLLIGNKTARAQELVSVIWAGATLVLMGALFGFSFYTVKRFRSDQQRVERIGELVQLRRWPEAAVAVDQYLTSPARTHGFRAQALVYLSSVLARLHRFEDAIAVHNQLLEEGTLDEGSAATVRLARAMAMLREDHLFDADRAINELRRGPLAGSAGLALVEIYRDVKTGHPAEATELFEQKREVLRDQLGHRVADAYALAARAYDLLGREAEARSAFQSATLLAPVAELLRRYPEVEKLTGRYPLAAAPPEAA
jgi:tetratricopeptide (TPR) repeat protein